MMEDEMRRQRYRILRKKLYGIKEEIEELNETYEEVISSMKKSLLIDDKIVEESTMETVNKTNHSILNDLSINVIPLVSRNC